MFGAVFLNEAEDRIKENDENDSDRIGDFPQQNRNDGSAEKDHDHNIPELTEENFHCTVFLIFAENIQALSLQPFSRNFFRKTHNLILSSNVSKEYAADE